MAGEFEGAAPYPPATDAPGQARVIRRRLVAGGTLAVVAGALLLAVLFNARGEPGRALVPPVAPTLAPATASPAGVSQLVVTPVATPTPAAATAVALPPTDPPAAPTSPPPPATATDVPTATLAPATPTAGATVLAAATDVPPPTTGPPTPPAGATAPQSPAAGPTVAAGGLPLTGRRIALDPGHGPRGDLGAVLVDQATGRLVLAESELNLDVGLRTRDLLRARGAAVVMTRETADTFTAPWPPDTNGDGIKGGASDDLQERVDIMNGFHAEVFLSMHANSSVDPAKRQGIQALDCVDSDCPFPAQEHRLGQIVLDQLAQHLAAVGDPVQRSELRNDSWSDVPGEPPGHLFLLGPVNPPHHVRAALMPGVIVESLYVTSPAEAALLKQDSVRQAIAQAYADALQLYLTTAP